MDPVISYGLLCAIVLYILYKRATRISLADIPGPEPESFFLGEYHLAALYVCVINEVVLGSRQSMPVVQEPGW